MGKETNWRALSWRTQLPPQLSRLDQVTLGTLSRDSIQVRNLSETPQSHTLAHKALIEAQVGSYILSRILTRDGDMTSLKLLVDLLVMHGLIRLLQDAHYRITHDITGGSGSSLPFAGIVLHILNHRSQAIDFLNHRSQVIDKSLRWTPKTGQVVKLQSGS